LIQAIRTTLEAVERIASQPAAAFPASVDGAAFANEFPQQVLDHLIATYLLQQQDRLAQLLKLSGVVRVEAVSPAGLRPGYVRRSIAWTDLGRVLNEPGATFRGAYQWGTAAFAQEAFLADLADLARAWGLDAVFDWPQAELRTFLVAGAPALEDVHEYLLRAPLVKEEIGFADIEAGIAVSALPATDAAPPGFAVLPYARGTGEQRTSLSDRVELVFEGGFNVQGGVSVLVRPGRPVEVVVDIIDSIAHGAAPVVAARIAARLAVQPAPGDETLVLIGSRDGSRLELRSASAAGGVRVNSAGKADAFVEANLERARLVVRPGPGQADSFLESLLPAQGIELSTDVLVGLSTSQGFYFGGSGGLEVELPAHVRLGPIEVTSATLAPGFRSSWPHVGVNLRVELRECVKGRGGSCAYAAAAVHAGDQAGSKTEILGGGSMESAW
jgi:hypothetical protein